MDRGETDMARQATEEELDGLMNGWRELRIGELIPIGVPAMIRDRGRFRPWRRVTTFTQRENVPYNSDHHVIICIEAD